MTIEEHTALFKEYIGKSKEELNAIINTGMFNSIIEGYLVLTLKGIGAEAEAIQEARTELKTLFNEVTAEEARAAIEPY